MPFCIYIVKLSIEGFSGKFKLEIGITSGCWGRHDRRIRSAVRVRKLEVGEEERNHTGSRQS